MLVIARDKNIIILAIQSAEDKHVITRALLEDEREKKRKVGNKVAQINVLHSEAALYSQKGCGLGRGDAFMKERGVIPSACFPPGIKLN